MRNITIALFIISLSLLGCKKEDDEIKGFYDYVHYSHEGSGQITFDVYPTNNTDSLNIIIKKYNFRDTTINLKLNNSTNNEAFSLYYKAINNQYQINGDYKESSLATGVFIDVYVVTKENKTEITNTYLREKLISLEDLVLSKIE